MFAFGDESIDGENPDPLISDEIWNEVLDAESEEELDLIIEKRLGILTDLDRKNVESELIQRSVLFFNSHPTVTTDSEEELRRQNYHPIGWVRPDSMGSTVFLNQCLKSDDDLKLSKDTEDESIYNVWSKK